MTDNREPILLDIIRRQSNVIYHLSKATEYAGQSDTDSANDHIRMAATEITEVQRLKNKAGIR